MPRLLILCEYPTLLGGERSMLATLPAVAAAGFDVRVAGPPGGPLAAVLRECSISRLDWQTHDERDERRPLERLRVALAEILRQTGSDLLHANSLSTARISGPVAADVGVRSIGHLRDIIKLNKQAIGDLNCHRRLLAVSRATRDFHVVQGIDATKCVTVHNGVDLDRFRPTQPSGYLHRELGLPDGALLVAVIGQLGLRKGTDVALMAALQVAERLPDVHWLVVGERTSHKEESRDFETLLRSIAAEQPLAGRVHFLGSRDDVAQLLPECSLLVHSARQEPLGRVLLEAAACGSAIVATDVGGTCEIFPAGADAAVLVKPDSHADLAAAVHSVFCDDGRRTKLGKSARQRAEQAFDIRMAAARLIEQYQIVLT